MKANNTRHEEAPRQSLKPDHPQNSRCRLSIRRRQVNFPRNSGGVGPVHLSSMAGDDTLNMVSPVQLFDV
jgi:hypothetical protein